VLTRSYRLLGIRAENLPPSAGSTHRSAIFATDVSSFGRMMTPSLFPWTKQFAEHAGPRRPCEVRGDRRAALMIDVQCRVGLPSTESCNT
jgi:hypothetical protein